MCKLESLMSGRLVSLQSEVGRVSSGSSLNFRRRRKLKLIEERNDYNEVAGETTISAERRDSFLAVLSRERRYGVWGMGGGGRWGGR